MNTTKFIATAAAILLVSGIPALFAEPGAPQAPATSAVVPTLVDATAAVAALTNGPHITFATPVYEFGKVKAGDAVKYSYVFTNTGTGTLEVTHVQPQCGCTTAGDWTHKVETGQTGTVAISFNSANYNGPVFKTVTVTSNDKSQPTFSLQLKGTVWKPIEAVPSFVYMNVPAESPGATSTSVRIVNNSDEVMAITSVESNNKVFQTEVTTNTPGKEYQIIVKAVPPLSPGNQQGQLTVKTTSTNAPTLSISVIMNVQAAVAVMPAQMTIPPAPLGSKITQSVTIQNNGTNTLSVSDPKVNLDGVNVEIHERQPGHSYEAVLTFPEGYKLPEYPQAEFTVKTSHPQFQVIKVPIIQLPKPVQPLTPNRPPQAAAVLPGAKAPAQ
jgi:hypothetical protein